MITAALGLDGLDSIAHDDRMATLDESRLAGQVVDQPLVSTDPSPDNRSGGCAAGMARPVAQGTNAR